MSLGRRDGTRPFGAACRFKHIKLLRVCQALFLVQQRLGDCQVRCVYFVLQLGCENFGHVCSWLSRAKAVQQLEYGYERLELRLGCVHHRRYRRRWHLWIDGKRPFLRSTLFWLNGSRGCEDKLWWWRHHWSCHDCSFAWGNKSDSVHCSGRRSSVTGPCCLWDFMAPWRQLLAARAIGWRWSRKGRAPDDRESIKKKNDPDLSHRSGGVCGLFLRVDLLLEERLIRKWSPFEWEFTLDRPQELFYWFLRSWSFAEEIIERSSDVMFVSHVWFVSQKLISCWRNYWFSEVDREIMFGLFLRNWSLAGEIIERSPDVRNKFCWMNHFGSLIRCYFGNGGFQVVLATFS